MKQEFATHPGHPHTRIREPLIYLAGHILGNEPRTDHQMRRTHEKAAGKLEQAGFKVFLPQRDNPFGVLHEKSAGWEMARVDRQAIHEAELIFAVGGFGKDTSWELGFAERLGKPVILWLPNQRVASYHREDWMLLSGVNAIVGPLEACEVMRSSVAVPPSTRILELNDLFGMRFALQILSSPIEYGFFSRAVGVL